MNNLNVILGLVNIVSGFMYIGIAIPMLNRKIPPNRWYGFRIAKAFQSKGNWYAINAYGAAQLVVASVPMMLVGIVALFVPIDTSNAKIMILVFGVAPLVLCTAAAVFRTLSFAKNN